MGSGRKWELGESGNLWVSLGLDRSVCGPRAGCSKSASFSSSGPRGVLRPRPRPLGQTGQARQSAEWRNGTRRCCVRRRQWRSRSARSHAHLHEHLHARNTARARAHTQRHMQTSVCLKRACCTRLQSFEARARYGNAYYSFATCALGCSGFRCTLQTSRVSELQDAQQRQVNLQLVGVGRKWE